MFNIQTSGNKPIIIIKILQSNSDKSTFGKDQHKGSFYHKYRISQNEKGKRKTECSEIFLRIDKVERIKWKLNNFLVTTTVSREVGRKQGT